MSNRIWDHPILGKLETGRQIDFLFDGIAYAGNEGDTIASALLASGVRTLRVHEETGTPRGIYCNIGHCYECRVTVDSMSSVRACMTLIKADMRIESGKMRPAPPKGGTSDV